MSVRLTLSAGIVPLLLGMSSASAAVIPISSYDMYNGNGTAQYGAYNYYDHSYSGVTGNGTVNGNSSNIPSSANANNYLSGGKGLLSDGVIANQNYTSVPGQYVGWKYQDPTITFHLPSNYLVNSITLYAASSFLGNLGIGGLVGAPGSFLVNGLSTGFSVSSSQYLGTEYSYADMITLTFSQPILSSLAFAVTLNRGSLLQDGIDYGFNHITNPCTTVGDPNCFVDNVSGFKENALDVNKQPWIMLSEVQFDGVTAAVPETSTWIMMIVGFAGLAFAASRRKAKAVLQGV